VIAGAAGARRIVELGTALGYTACWFAHGAPDARIDTIDFDPEHVRLAGANIEAAGFGKRVTLHEGAFDEVLPKLKPGYDVGFFDGFDPTMRNLKELRTLLRPGGVLITTNLNSAARRAAIASDCLTPNNGSRRSLPRMAARRSASKFSHPRRSQSATRSTASRISAAEPA
jgi:predicted O-methyltransferase YrrM